MTTRPRIVWTLLVAALVASLAVPAGAFDITPAVQAELDRQKAAVAGWAADPVVVGAVREQNAKGPIEGMDNAKWKTVRRSDPVVQAMVKCAAGQLLKKRIEASGGALDKAFISAAQGEKVAFAEKTISYLHRGQDKFDVPMSTGKPWQMAKPWFDESLQGYALQVAAPVIDGGKPIGVIVASVPLTHLEKLVKK